MSRYSRSRLAGIAIAIILIVFAFLAILSANSLVWTLSLEGRNTNNHSIPIPPTGELLVQATLSQYSGFALNGTTIITPGAPDVGPLPGVTVSVFALNQRLPLVSAQTGPRGSLALNFTQGLYTAHLNTTYSIFTVQFQIISGHVIYLSLNVNGTQHIASFYDLSELQFIGLVLPTEPVYLEINNAQGKINSSAPVYLATYNGYFIGMRLITTTELTNASVPCCNGTSTLIQNFFQVQQVPATVISLSESFNNSLWVKVTPNSPLSTAAVQYVGLEQFLTTYTITNSSSGVPQPNV